MKSHHQTKSKPCPCGGICDCHKPQEGMSDLAAVLIFILGLFPLVAFPFIIHALGKSQPRHIEVNGQNCIVEYHQDSAGPVIHGHDVANCGIK
jgi:hypothetical protein